MIQLIPEVKDILRQGLLGTHEARKDALHELQTNFRPSDSRYAVAGLKDYSTTIDDLYRIETGNHYKEWIQHNIKEEQKLLLEDGNLLNQLRNTEAKENSIPIKDSFGTNEELKINVDLKDILAIEIGDRKYGSLANGKSNDKLMKCLSVFNELSEVDKEDIVESILLEMEKINKKEQKKPSKKTFVNAVNEQLSDAERKDMIGLLLSQAKNSFKKAY